MNSETTIKDVEIQPTTLTRTDSDIVCAASRKIAKVAIRAYRRAVTTPTLTVNQRDLLMARDNYNTGMLGLAVALGQLGLDIEVVLADIIGSDPEGSEDSEDSEDSE